MRKIKKAIYGIALWFVTPLLYAMALYLVLYDSKLKIVERMFANGKVARKSRR